jgi:hypothetical protein
LSLKTYRGGRVEEKEQKKLKKGTIFNSGAAAPPRWLAGHRTGALRPPLFSSEKIKKEGERRELLSLKEGRERGKEKMNKKPV